MASHGNMSVPLHVMLNYGAKGENRMMDFSCSDSTLLLCVGLKEAYCIYMGMSMTQMRHGGLIMLLNPSVILPKLTVKTVTSCFDLMTTISYCSPRVLSVAQC